MPRLLLTTLIVLLLGAVFVDSVDAQRRRRRRRRQPPPTEEPAEPPAEGEATAEGEASAPPASPFEEPEEDAAAEGEPTPPVEGAPTPEGEAAEEPATEQPTAQYDPGPAPPDISPIRDDYVALMDDLVQARSRVHALGSELFRTRITIDLQDRTGDRTNLARLVVRLDGAPVFQSDGGIEGGDDGREVFAGALAPGPHVLRLEIEQRASADDTYRYTLQEDFRFQVARERLSEVTVVLEDESDIATSFPSGGEGRYEVRTRMRVATRALPDR